jgi:MtN3 and saliva related transmembrane protein
MDWLSPIDLLGAVAGTLTTISFVPQVVKTLRTRQTRDISLAMWIAFVAGVALWTVYGLLLGAWPIVAANLPTLGLAGIILAVKVRNMGNETGGDKPPA